MKLELKIVEFFKHLEELEINISLKTSKSLIEEYYNYLGFNDDSSMEDWFKSLANSKYPLYSKTEKAMKTARNFELRWRRNLT